MLEEPAVDLRELKNLFDGHPTLQRLADRKNPLRIRDAEAAAQCIGVKCLVCPIPKQTKSFDLEASERLLHGFLESPTDRHSFTHAFHLRGESGISLRKFFEREPRKLDHNVINRGLETRRCLPRDIIPHFIQRVTNREFCSNLRDWKTGRL